MNRPPIAPAFLVLISPLCQAVDFAPRFQSREMAAHQYANSDAVGDLGGVPVTIPKHFASYMEYDGAPGWGKKRTDPTPRRMYASRIKSLGFDVRYPNVLRHPARSHSTSILPFQHNSQLGDKEVEISSGLPFWIESLLSRK